MSERRLQSPAGPLTRSSKSYAEDDKAALSEALAAFQAALTDAERTRLQQTKTSFCDADAVIKFTHDLDGLDPARRGKSIATKLYSFLQTIQQFYQVTDTYVKQSRLKSAVRPRNLDEGSLDGRYIPRNNSKTSVQGKKLRQNLEQNWESLLIKLSSYDHAAAFRKARLRRHNGTAEWVFPTQQFQNWFHSDKSSILHLTGKIGSGKTVLTANVIDHLIAERKSCQLVSFFFVAFDDAASLSAEHIIRCLIRQALDHSSVNDKFIHGLRKAESRFFSNDALLGLWAEKVKSVDELFVVLDGLDECSESERELLLGCLAKLGDAVSGESRVKVLLSSRETIVDEVDRSDLSVSRLGLSTANIQSDLSKYAEEILMQRVSTKKLKIDNEHLLQEVIRQVQRGGEGMFLWVFLTVEDLCTRKSDIEIRNALQTIPRNLSGTFDRALARIVANGHEKVAHDTFRWAAVVRRPLATDQLREALAIEIGQMYYRPERLINGIDQITAWCENLVQIEETDNTVHFSHHSIRKYLLDPTSEVSRSFHINLQDWDHHVGEILSAQTGKHDS
ncbi:nacht domain protein [Colletotrichum karsti]|uniref:Nacht domain protein n=1 Tax=Colletotrichum karsti TaxID=1095194 RepID=A0A9P6I7H0_9PEZI|nr:nacht domain protein [Colletotrichum karsti]KAF9877162.1 nacht domain protein [Colletotrichum karsti]